MILSSYLISVHSCSIRFTGCTQQSASDLHSSILSSWKVQRGYIDWHGVPVYPPASSYLRKIIREVDRVESFPPPPLPLLLIGPTECSVLRLYEPSESLTAFCSKHMPNRSATTTRRLPRPVGKSETSPLNNVRGWPSATLYAMPNVRPRSSARSGIGWRNVLNRPPDDTSTSYYLGR